MSKTTTTRKTSTKKTSEFASVPPEAVEAVLANAESQVNGHAHTLMALGIFCERTAGSGIDQKATDLECLLGWLGDHLQEMARDMYQIRMFVPKAGAL